MKSCYSDVVFRTQVQVGGRPQEAGNGKRFSGGKTVFIKIQNASQGGSIAGCPKARTQISFTRDAET